jgi:hypothetical protein
LHAKELFLTQPERGPEDMSALSVESLSLPINQSQSNNNHSQVAEIINPEENSTPKEIITVDTIDPQHQVIDLTKPSEEIKTFKSKKETNNDEREVIKEEVENDAVASKALILTKSERMPENTSALSMESLFSFPTLQSKLFSSHS